MKVATADELAKEMSDWRVVGNTAAVRLSRCVQWVFEHVLYRFGVRGATTVAKLGCRLLKNDTAVVSNPLGASFSFPAWDSYYGHYIFGKREYEPEIALLLAAHSTNDAASFLDCGANYGYWSVLAASVVRGSVAAIELNPVIIDCLRDDPRGRPPHFAVINAAVWDVDGTPMNVSRVGPNQGHSAEVASAASEVLSRSIDSVVAELALPAADLLVKIDCEGAEVRALAGASETAMRGACFVLEDHGSDPECVVSQRLFELDWSVAIFDSTSRRWRQVTDLDEVKKMKTDPIRGYNVFAWSGALQPTFRAAFA